MHQWLLLSLLTVIEDKVELVEETKKLKTKEEPINVFNEANQLKKRKARKLQKKFNSIIK